MIWDSHCPQVTAPPLWRVPCPFQQCQWMAQKSSFKPTQFIVQHIKVNKEHRFTDNIQPSMGQEGCDKGKRDSTWVIIPFNPSLNAYDCDSMNFTPPTTIVVGPKLQSSLQLVFSYSPMRLELLAPNTTTNQFTREIFTNSQFWVNTESAHTITKRKLHRTTTGTCDVHL